MDADDLAPALLAFVAIVVVAPVWVHYVEGFSAARPEGAFLAGLTLPAAAALYVTSWVKPELASLVLGAFLLVATMLLAPWLWQFTDMAAGALGGQPMARTLVRLAVPVVLLAFLATFGVRRLVRG